MKLSRRHLLGGLAATSLAACVAPMGSRSSYLTQVLAPQNNNTVFHWLDVFSSSPLSGNVIAFSKPSRAELRKHAAQNGAAMLA